MATTVHGVVLSDCPACRQHIANQNPLLEKTGLTRIFLARQEMQQTINVLLLLLPCMSAADSLTQAQRCCPNAGWLHLTL